MPLIVNGGKSALKIAAIARAAGYFPELRSYEVVASDAESLVRRQPEIIRVTPGGLREHEAFKGAWNRAHGASKARPDGDIFVGIENAVIDLGFVADIPVIVVIDRNGREFYGTGTGIAVPRRDYQAALSMGFERTTVGERLAARCRGVQHTNPHLALTGRSREESVADGLTQAFGAMLVAKSATSASV